MATESINSRAGELEIPMESPFINDALNNRAQFAHLMTQIVDLYGDKGCVLSLNGQWGSGKTTFVKMWEKQLKNDGYRTVYFNAWKYDYTDNPLVALVSQLEQISKDKGGVFDNVVGCFGKILINASGAVINGLSKKYLGADSQELARAVTDATIEIGKDALHDFNEQSQTLGEFKKHLSEFVASPSTDSENCKIPVIFFIDELDRCNPTYAVKTLEIVKHLFDVPNIVFVLSINKEQLCCAIQGYYGSNEMNAAEYLKRFIDIEMNLPEGNIESYCRTLLDKFNFDSYFDVRKMHQAYQSDKEQFIDGAVKICKHKHLNLRAIEKLFVQCRLSLMDYSANHKFMPEVFFYLCYLRGNNALMYNKIANQQYNMQQLIEALEDELPEDMLAASKEDDTAITSDGGFVNWLIATMMFLYANSYSRDTPKEWHRTEDGKKMETSLKFNKCDKDKILDILLCISNDTSNQYLNMGFVLNKIELLDYVNFNTF